MSYHSNLLLKRQKLANEALSLARELEAGRAQAPFQEKLSALASTASTHSLRIGILAPSPEIAHALLADFLGPDYNVCKIVVPSRLGFSEVLLQERGFLLDAGDGPREFADATTFVEALKATHTLETKNTPDLEPLRLKLKAPAHLNGLCLLIPQDLDTLVRRPALLSTLADQADWIYLAGDAQTCFTPAQHQAIQLVLDHVTGLQNALLPAAALQPPTTPNPAAEWWKSFRVPLSLGLVRIGSDLLKKRLALLTAPDSELRQYLVETRLHRQLEMNLSLMADEVDQLQRQLANRANLAREGLASQDTAPDLRKTAETVRTAFAEELDNLLKSSEREAKASLQPDGTANTALRQTASLITTDDIDRADEGNITKLSLTPPTAQRLADEVSHLARQRLATDLHLLHEGVECSLRDARLAIEKATGTRPILTAELPDENTLWDTISTLARPEIRYRGEIPRATLATRFGAARQVIMGLMILGTLLGGLSFFTGDQTSSQHLRTLLAALTLPLLVLAFLWTYISFRKKEKITLSKELEKLQDGVLSELRRVLQDLHREQMTLISQAAQKTIRSIQQQLEQTFSSLEKQRQRDHDDQRRRQTEQQRSTDQRLARLRQHASQIASLRTELKDADRLRAQWLAAWIEKFNQNKP